MNINDLCDYIILRVRSSGASLSNLKLQKLMYYTQAWHLAFYNTPLVNANFQAWIHGPVLREIYDRFSLTKSLYSDVQLSDIRPNFEPETIREDVRRHIDAVLEIYADFSGLQLEEMTHNEDPWINARRGYRPTERCENFISNDDMRIYYSRRLTSPQNS